MCLDTGSEPTPDFLIPNFEECWPTNATALLYCFVGTALVGPGHVSAGDAGAMLEDFREIMRAEIPTWKKPDITHTVAIQRLIERFR